MHCLFVIGKQCPSFIYLHRYVIETVGSKWYDVGIDLLGKNDVKALQSIRDDPRNNPKTSCIKMFELWLERQPKASWNQLIKSLRQPNIALNTLASRIEHMLLQPKPAGM